MNVTRIMALLLAPISITLPACQRMHAEEKEHAHEEHHKIVVTSAQDKDVTVTQQYVCQISSQKKIEVSPLVGGRIEEIAVKQGHMVKKGDPMFKILQTPYQAKLAAELAEVQLAQIELDNARKLYNGGVKSIVSQTDVAIAEAKLAKAMSTADRTRLELDFTVVRAPFDGIVDVLEKQVGSVVKEGEVLTTLYDNSTMWVYFNVPEVRCLEYTGSPGRDIEPQQLELVLANGSKFDQPCKAVTRMGKYDNETGTIRYLAELPNPHGRLRHGQTGTVLIRRVLNHATLIPQRATFEILDKRYVYVVGKDNVLHQREIVVKHELEDIFVIKSGLEPDEKIVYEGVRQVRDGDRLDHYEFRAPDELLANLKNRAE
jgi:membrane fusion protein (multidrug efflux system)